MSQPATENRSWAPRIEVIDGLRLVAALMVVLYHYTYRAPGVWGGPTTAVFAPVAQVTGYGFLGVELFFMISGFVISMSAWGGTLGRFAMSRLCRLYPAYWFAVILTSVVLRVSGRGDHLDGWRVLVNLTMLQAPLGVPDIDGVYWTLWIELRFYLLFSLVVAVGVTARRVMGFCAAWTAVSDALILAGRPTWLCASHSSFFVAGMTLFLVYRSGWSRGRIAMLCVAFAHSACSVRASVAAVSAAHGLPLSQVAGFAVVAAGYGVMVAVASGQLSRVRGAWLTAAGLLTYPLYLLHQQIGYVVIASVRGLASPALILTAVVTGMIGAAFATHVAVERPLARGLRSALPTLAPRRRRPAPVISDVPRESSPTSGPCPDDR